MHSTLVEEDFPARLEAVFPDRDSALAARTHLCRRFALDAAQFGLAERRPGVGGSHRNRFAVRASGRSSQKRQLHLVGLTFLALVALFVLIALLEFLGAVSTQFISITLAVLLLAALVPLAIGLLSWRRSGVRGDASLCLGNRTVLLVDVHDLSEQYEIRAALLELGASVDSSDIAGVS